jgi:nucleoside-diphosphate-sugar epimerase
MKALVTGGAGFIGSHLCEKLLIKGYEVVCVDNFITGNPRNVDNLKGGNFMMVEHDINLPLDSRILTEIGKIDRIYHLACPASPVDYREIPLQTLWVNAAGMKNALELAVKNNAAFLHASTSEVYGDPQEHPQKESYWGNVNPIGERSCYNEGKRYAESMAMAYYRVYRLPLKIVRIFNTFGPKMRKNDGRVIPEFIRLALSGEPLRVNGGGSQTRSFCYIDDMVEGLMAAMETPAEFIGPVNLGNPEEISITELAKKIIGLAGSGSSVVAAGMPQDDPMKRKPDITLAKTAFGFEPKTSLEEGLKKTIAYFRGGEIPKPGGG